MRQGRGPKADGLRRTGTEELLLRVLLLVLVLGRIGGTKGTSGERGGALVGGNAANEPAKVLL